ncbi:hypothetical protein CK203_016566 [Vitis vinifera]|uniref:Uncharacterized protein n=1 Tax=Vitis vinifera TaxID=29760 RepID=A0A438J184_VITVI|nr:hypothetical protein CK203_016566 [Vitis vinifera]
MDSRLAFHFRHGTDPMNPSRPFTETHYEGGTAIGPSSPAPQHRYETRRPPTTPDATISLPESLVWCPPTKRARTSGPGESSIASEPLAYSEIVEQDPSTRSYILIRRPCDNNLSSETLTAYSRCTTLSTHDSSPIAIHFTIDGRHGVLEARHIAEAL